MQQQRTNRIKVSGMSLIEVILAIAVAGFVLAAAVSFLISISTIWADRTEKNFFEDHADGVTEFLNATFMEAGIKIALADQDSSPPVNEGENEETEGSEPNITTEDSEENNSESSHNGGLIQGSEKPLGWGRTPGSNEFDDPLLSFNLKEAPPLLVNATDKPIGSVALFLHFERNEGLSLLWHSTLQEEVEDIDDLHRTTISTLVKQLEFIYWDNRFERWETETEPRKDEESEEQNSFLLPRFLKLTFEHEEITKERTVSIPVPSQKAFLF